VSDRAASGAAVRRPGTPARPRRLGRMLIGLGIVSRTFRSRRFYERVIVGAVALAALSGMGKESGGRAIERLIAYARKLDQRAEHAVRPRAR
jgi:hypothetical protein